MFSITRCAVSTVSCKESRSARSRSASATAAACRPCADGRRGSLTKAMQVGATIGQGHAGESHDWPGPCRREPRLAWGTRRYASHKASDCLGQRTW
eukprot:6425140-Pyramimonas_sp.AAC.2